MIRTATPGGRQRRAPTRSRAQRPGSKLTSASGSSPRVEDSRPRFGRRRRLPAVELRLRQLRGVRAGTPAAAPAHAGVGRGQRRRRALVPAQRLARDPRADRGFPRCGRAATRHSPIAGILLTNGDLDHCLGLLSLRESHPLVVYATDAVRAGFTSGNVLYRTLERFPGQVTWRALALGRGAMPLGGADAPARSTRGAGARQAAAAPRGARRRRPRTTSASSSATRARAERWPISRASPARVARACERAARRAPTWCSSTARSGPATS